MTKKLVLFLFISLLTLSTQVKAYAETLQSEKPKHVKVDNLHYSLVGNEAHVRWNGSYKKFSGEIVIPSTIDYKGQTYTVTALEDDAFFGSRLTTIVIPESVNAIGKQAFRGSLLLKIKFPSNVKEIAPCTFRNCQNLDSVEIAEGVTCIGDSAFQGCINLVSVKIPESVSRIKSFAFSYCGSLLSIDIPKGVTHIDRYAFENCKRLRTINFSEGLVSLGKRAFSVCPALRSIVLPKSLKDLGEETFLFCNRLEEVTLHKGITSYINPFSLAEQLKVVYTDDKNLTCEALTKGERIKRTFKIEYIYSQLDENNAAQVDLDLIKKAINNGDKEAMITLGELYESGQCVEQSDLMAEEMYRKAMDNNLNNEKARKKMANVHKKILEGYRKSLTDGYRSNYKDVKFDTKFLDTFLSNGTPETKNLVPLAKELIEANKVLDAVNGGFQKYVGFVGIGMFGPKNKPEWWPEHVDSDTKKLADALTIAKSTKSECGFEQFFSTAANKLIPELQKQQVEYIAKEERRLRGLTNAYNRELEEQGRKSKIKNANEALANSDEGIPEFDKVFSDKKWSDFGNLKKKFLKFKGETEGFTIYYSQDDGYQVVGEVRTLHYKTEFDAIAAYYVKLNYGLTRTKNQKKY